MTSRHSVMGVRRLAALQLSRSCSSASASSTVPSPPEASTVHRPQYYRKHHQHHTPKHILQEEFPNAGDVSGSGVRLFDYYKTAEIVNKLPTIKEKIDFVSPYERGWTRAEKTWRRAWHPTLMATRKAWAIPPVPAYFDCLKYYQYITKTRLVNGPIDQFYVGIVPPTQNYEKAVSERLISLLNSTRFDSEKERTDAIIATLFDEAVLSVAHNVSRLADYRTAYDVQCESFWIRSGFSFLYDEQDVGKTEIYKKLHNSNKFIGDDRRKLGELAFVSRDRLAVQLRSRESPSNLLLKGEATQLPIFSDDVILEDVLFSPKVMNMWPDDQPLWQCAGYFAESGETHGFTRVSGKSLSDLNERCQYWGGDSIEEKEELWNEAAQSQAIATLFTTLNAQAHAIGFTQYTDLTHPLTSQLVLSDGNKFVFSVGQLNTIAINIECDGFVNDQSNVCFIENPIYLYNGIEDGKFYHYVNEEKDKPSKRVKGLNPKVLQRILQMILRD